MKLPLSWLKEYVDVKISADKLVELLTMAGIEVASQEERDSEKVFEIEITPNRPDWLSVIGLAREVAALTKSKSKIKSTRSVKPDLKEKNQFAISVQDKKDCPLYSARLIRDCIVGPATAKIIKRVESLGLRPVNNIVDITNFCLFETGQPLHAFDFDKLAGGKIVVRRAKNGESITTIDGAKHKLDPRILVIADAEKPVAIAGIMGGKDAEVNEGTKNILLESAYFDPVLTRRASRMLGLSSDSSYRFERKVDLDNVVAASNRASLLIKDIAGGRISELRVNQSKRKSSATLSLNSSAVNNILGIELSTSAIKDILSRLGFKVKNKKDVLKVTCPTFREDVSCQEDLIEEVARIYGYDNIPARLALVRPYLSKEPRINLHWLFQELREILVAQGLFESITYCLASSKLSGSFCPEGSLVKTINPLSAEQEFMRPLILPGLLAVVERNKNRQEPNVNIFEVGNVYQLDKNVSETAHLAVVLSGNLSFDWQNKATKAGIFHLKGILENALDDLGIHQVEFIEKSHAFLEPAASLAIKVKTEDVGFIGQAAKKILSSTFDIKDDVFALEIDLEKILKLVNLDIRLKALPKYPASKRDISVIVKLEAKHSAIVDVIKKAAGANLKDVLLLDEYIGKQVPAGHKSLTYSLIYQSPNSTLAEEEINSAQQKIINSLKQSFNAGLRSSI